MMERPTSKTAPPACWCRKLIERAHLEKGWVSYRECVLQRSLAKQKWPPKLSTVQKAAGYKRL
jgi:hypothetical protein